MSTTTVSIPVTKPTQDIGMTLRPGDTAPDFTAETTHGVISLGESSNAAGTGDGITSGRVGWTTVTLKPGHYELLCNLANHYADGMYQELIVT